jgi:head-tail adaptor
VIGAMRERVIAQKLVSEPADALGGHSNAWRDSAEFWARVEPGPDGARVTCRWRGDVAPGDRLIWRGQVLRVTGAADADGQRRLLVLTAEAV